MSYGISLSSSESFIERYLDDDWGTLTYNSVFDIENSVLTFIPKPLDFVERNHWPVTVAFSEPKTAGNFSDNYTIFPVNNIKDLDYTRGPITQMFLLQNIRDEAHRFAISAHRSKRKRYPLEMVDILPLLRELGI